MKNTKNDFIFEQKLIAWVIVINSPMAGRYLLLHSEEAQRQLADGKELSLTH